MLATIQSESASCARALPNERRGAYWLADAEGKKIAFAEAKQEGWAIKPAEGLSFTGKDAHPDERIVSFDKTMILSLEGDHERCTIVFRPDTDGDRTTRIIGFSDNVEIAIGRSEDNDIVYSSEFVSSQHARLTLEDEGFFIEDSGSANGVFVNGLRIAQNSVTHLKNGDVVTILGLHLTIGNRFISLNNPEGNVKVKANSDFVNYHPPKKNPGKPSAPTKRRYFYPALRFARSIERKSFAIDAPPQPDKEDETPIAMRIGPSLVMAMASIMSAAVSVMFIMEQGSGVLRAVPMFAMAIAMLGGSVLWPILNKRYQHKKHEQKEAQRKSAYSQYLGKVRSELLQESLLQKEILEENRISPDECILAAMKADVNFMSRTPLHKDYLELRIGRGEEPLLADINFPVQGFDVVEDDLRDAVDAFAREPHVLKDVPLSHSLIERPILGVVGKQELADAFIRNLVIQIAAMHAYSEVKIVILCDEETRRNWVFAMNLPHLFSDEKSIRFFASSLDEANALGMILEKELELRTDGNGFDARDAKPYYVLICPSKIIYDKSKVVRDILELKSNFGFSVIASAEKMHELPIQCRATIKVEENEAYLLNRDDPTGTRKAFRPDEAVDIECALSFALNVARARLDLTEASDELPERLSFMQMFDVGNIDYLNVADRWRENNASDTLATSIGVDSMGDPFILNLHEDFHGPHGLIAGTTGSGKSEFIITYVLSMALNYSPDDVAFVLIDYKGGGLAKAFDNDRFRLPHIAGTITNLDGSAISRSLSSIQSELRRRQRLFNETREVLGGDNVDIYKYLDLFRQGRVTEPCPHLILIADEFAELKQQEPEFMDELISASRIGRSLGVHLILATQKPSGVVNDQIWSNSRFKIALKVADASDSQEIIRRADAAEITQPGRFFLMVGYNEYYDEGQSGYSGVPYVPNADSDVAKDTSVNYISDTGRILLSVKSHSDSIGSSGKSQIVAVAEHIVDVAAEQHKQAQMLWLPPLAPFIRLQEIERRFGHDEIDGCGLNPVIGMYDDPSNQKQGLLTLPLLKEGNAVIYGTPDSGVELILKAVVFSALQTHSSRTLNVYILDFGSQSLSAFASAPQVGDVVLVDDEEKVKRFFSFMASMISHRRSLFASYGGSYVRYCERNDDCPVILVVINGVSTFLETYGSFEESLISFARESAQVGMRLVITGESTGAVRMRLRSHFRQVLACDLPDESEYTMLFGSMRGVPVPHGFGRGLIRIEDELFEFQAASVCAEDDSEYDYIESSCEELSKKAAKEGWRLAQSIPMPPKTVMPDMLVEAKTPEGCASYGVYDDTLEAAYFDFAETPLMRVNYLKTKTGAAFASAVIEAWTKREQFDVAVIDITGIIQTEPKGCVFATRKNEFAAQFLNKLADHDIQRPTVVIVSGMMELLGSCSMDIANSIKAYIKSLKAGGPVSFLLLDIANDASYAYEDWFKVHMTNRDGLWIGAGVESQNAISISYTRNLLPDKKMNEHLGYQIEGGITRLVHVASIGDGNMR